MAITYQFGLIQVNYLNDGMMMTMHSEDGRLLKLINTSRGRHQLHPVVVEVLQVFSQPVVHVHIHGPGAGRRQGRHGGQDDANEGRGNAVEPRERVLVVASRVDIVLLPLQRCHTQTSCRQAVVLVMSVSSCVSQCGQLDNARDTHVIFDREACKKFVTKHNSWHCWRLV